MQRTDRSATPQVPVESILTTSRSALSELLRVLQAVRDGDFSVRLPGDWTGLEGKIADTVNGIVASNAKMATELERVGTVLATPGTSACPRLLGGGRNRIGSARQRRASMHIW